MKTTLILKNKDQLSAEVAVLFQENINEHLIVSLTKKWNVQTQWSSKVLPQILQKELLSLVPFLARTEPMSLQSSIKFGRFRFQIIAVVLESPTSRSIATTSLGCQSNRLLGRHLLCLLCLLRRKKIIDSGATVLLKLHPIYSLILSVIL